MSPDLQTLVLSLSQCFEDYRKACYGDRYLPPEQVVEVRQAFFSGMHAINHSDLGNRLGAVTEAIKELVKIPEGDLVEKPPQS